MEITIIPVGVLGTNCYILKSEQKNCVLIDPGAQPEKILDRIAREKVTPRFILLTHGHYDHVGAVAKLRETYPDIRVLAGKGDMDILTGNDGAEAAHRSGFSGEVLEDLESVEDRQELTLDELCIRVLETPGHSKGGVCFVCQDALFAGDTLFRGDVGRCDLYGGDYRAMLSSLRKLSALAGDYTVYPGHGESSTLDYERKNNIYILEALA